MTRILIIATILAAVGCNRVEKDTRQVFHIDPNRPFLLELGRGSGWHGLDTIRMDGNGCVVLHRMKSSLRGNVMALSWETATLQVQPAVVAQVLKAVEANGLMEMHRAYYDPNVKDGTQWVLLIRQGPLEKSVCFNNSFPRAISRFAVSLDSILATAGVGNITWQPMPDAAGREHEKELWDSVK